jgi:chromosome partitioning protein
LGIESGRNDTSLYEVLLGLASMDEIVRPTQVENLSIVPSNINLSGAQVEMVELDRREHRLSTALDPLRDRYEYIFIDSPPSLGLLTINGLVAADSVIIPIQCEYYALEGLSQLLKTIELVRSRLNKRLILEGVLLTMYDTRTNLSRQVVDEILAYFKNKVYKTIIPRNVRLAEAPSYGQPISIYDAKSIGAVSYFKLSREVMRNGEKSAG